MIKKAAVVIISILTFLVLAEISLRIFGYFYQPKSEKSKINNENYTVLSIGDSFTYGIGAPESKDYPSQLENILNSKTNKKFKVINRGIPGQNTSEVYKNLKYQIVNNKPDLIILLVGANNARNYWGFGSSFNKLLYKTRIYKLIELLYLNVKQKKINSIIEKQNWLNSVNDELKGASVKISKAEDIKSQVYKTAFDQNVKRMNKIDKTGADYFDIGTFYLREKKYNDALKWYIAGINSFPSYLKNYEGITYSYYLQNRINEAQKWIFTGLGKNENSSYLYSILGLIEIIKENYAGSLKWINRGLNADSNNIECRFYLNDMRKFYNNYLQRNPPYSVRTRVFEKLDSLIRKYPFDFTYYDSLENKRRFYYFSNTYYNTLKNMKKNNFSLIKEWVYNDLQKIIDLCKSNNTKMIIQNYPLPVNGPYFNSLANNILKDISAKNSVPFVDNAKIFNSKGGQKHCFFQPVYEGDHPNEKGYELMAENLFDKIVEINLFDKNIFKH
jgi:lysophospholipase L1-like esterase